MQRSSQSPPGDSYGGAGRRWALGVSCTWEEEGWVTCRCGRSAEGGRVWKAASTPGRQRWLWGSGDKGPQAECSAEKKPGANLGWRWQLWCGRVCTPSVGVCTGQVAGAPDWVGGGAQTTGGKGGTKKGSRQAANGRRPHKATPPHPSGAHRLGGADPARDARS